MAGSTPAVGFVSNYDTTPVLENWANWNLVFQGRKGYEVIGINIFMDMILV